MAKVFVCDDIPFPTLEGAQYFAKTYFNLTGQVVAIEIDEATPEDVPDAYGVMRFHRPNRLTRRRRRAAQKTAVYLNETRPRHPAGRD
jgi:hypothetical protein